jgi:predicted transcriptional regulator
MAEDAAVKTMVGSSPTPDLGQMMAQRSSMLKPYEESRTQARKQEQEFDAEKLAFEQAQKTKGLKVEKEAIGKQKTTVEEAYKPLETLEKNIQDTTFIPSEATATDLAALYGLIGVVGWGIGAGGKGDAMQAMSAMNGMLEGYQKGRQDIYKKEKEVFDLSVRNLRERARVVAENSKRIAELSALDRDAAKVEQAMLVAEESATFYKDNAARFGYAKAAQDADDLLKAADKMYFQLVEIASKQAKSTGRPQLVTGSDGTVYSIDADKIATPVMTAGGEAIKKQVKPVGGARAGSASGAGGAVQFRYNQAMTNAGNQLANEIENAASLPISATPPVLAEVLTDPTKGLTEAGKRFFAQKITDEESRAFQQVFAGMTRAITTIEASGRPSGATEGAIREFAKSQPRAGDKKINIYLSLAQSKQVMDILVKDLKAAQANSTQIAQAEEAKKRVDSLITWTVRDVNRILASGKSTLVDQKVQDAMESSKNLGELNKQVKPSSAKQYATEADADKAFKDGTLKSGDKVIINGQSGTWE